MNLPDAAQGEVVPRRESGQWSVFIEALRLLGQGTGQIECQGLTRCVRYLQGNKTDLQDVSAALPLMNNHHACRKGKSAGLFVFLSYHLHTRCAEVQPAEQDLEFQMKPPGTG